MAKKDYLHLEKDELIRIIEKLESRKKYGLVWDEEKTKAYSFLTLNVIWAVIVHLLLGLDDLRQPPGSQAPDRIALDDSTYFRGGPFLPEKTLHFFPRHFFKDFSTIPPWALFIKIL